MLWIIVGIVIVVAVTAYFVFGRSSEIAATHVDKDRHGSELFHGDDEAPAGPGAEDEAVLDRGVTGPGPGAEQFDDRT